MSTQKVKLSDVKKVYEKKLNEQLQERIKKLPEEVDELLRKFKNEITLNAIGMSNKWGEFEVDHCNGRNTAMANSIADRAIETVDNFIKPVLEELSQNQSFMNKLKKEFKKEFEEKVYYYMSKHLEQYAEDIAEREVEKLIKSTKFEYVKIQINEHDNNLLREQDELGYDNE